MESYIRIGLIFIVGCVIFFMLRDYFIRKKRNRDIPIMNLQTFSEMEFKSQFTQMDLFEDEIYSSEEPQIQISPSQNTPSLNKAKNKKTSRYESDQLIISVVAKQGKNFESYDLLQSISATGMQYGHNRLFHYYVSFQEKVISLFNLSSLSQPKEFDLDRMGDFSCKGLTLTLNLEEVPDPEFAFSTLLKTAEQLAEELDGELRAGSDYPWNESMLRLYYEKINDYVNTIEA